MNIRRLNKLCDRTLKALVKGKITNKYEINELDGDNQLQEDFFKTIRIKEQEIPFVIDTLLKNDFIEVFGSGGVSRYDHEKKKLLIAEVKALYMTKAGTIFIKSTSFRFEAIKSWIKLWWPLIIATFAFLTSLYSFFSATKTKSGQEMINGRLEKLEHNLDSLKKENFFLHNRKDS